MPHMPLFKRLFDIEVNKFIKSKTTNTCNISNP